MDGVGFALKACLVLLGGDTAQIISGGVTRSTVWPQNLVTIFQDSRLDPYFLSRVRRNYS